MIEIVLGCEADGCEERLRLTWPRGEYVSLIDAAMYGDEFKGDGSLTLDGSATVPRSANRWRVGSERREYTVRCPAHGDVA